MLNTTLLCVWILTEACSFSHNSNKLTYAEFYLLQNLFPQVIFFAIVQGSMSSLKAYTEEVKVNILTLALIEVEDTLHVLREF